MNIFNRKTENPDYTEKLDTIISSLDEQKEFQQILMNEIKTLKNEIGILKDYIHKEIRAEGDILRSKINIETEKTHDHLQHMTDITLTEDDIKEFSRIGYNYIKNEYNKEPVTITEALQNLETEDEVEAETVKHHLIKIPESLQQPYLLKLLPNGHFRNRNNTSKETKFTINDVIDLKEKIPYYHKKGYTKQMVSQRYPRVTLTVLNRLIWNIEEGNFDELINEYQRNYTNAKTNGLNFNIQDKYKKIYNVRKLEGITLYRKGQGNPRLGFTILDVLYIRDNIPRWVLEQTNKTTAAREAGMSKERLMRVIYNLQEGVFDKCIDEFENPQGDHKFTIISNNLYIDTKDTGLHMNACRTILHEYTNAEDKIQCLKNLLRTYNYVKEEHIVIITSCYNDSSFRDLILHSDKDNVTIVNNPEKRREYGTSLIGI